MKLIKKLGTKRNPSNGKLERFGLFYCEYCNKIIETKYHNALKNQSCGCAKKKLIGKANRTHGDSCSKIYCTWINMNKRCNCPSKKDSKYYKNKGIMVCKEWENDYLAFKKWALSHGYADNLTIDRIDNNGNYSPSNCQWITIAQNIRKSSRTKMSWLTVGLIRAMYEEGQSRKEIFDVFNISKSHLNSILNCRTWKEEVI